MNGCIQLLMDCLFYQNCCKFITNTQGGPYNYNSLSNTLTNYKAQTTNKPQIRQYIKTNIVGSNLYKYENEQQLQQQASQIFAILYMIQYTRQIKTKNHEEIVRRIKDVMQDSMSEDMWEGILEFFMGGGGGGG